ncbi:MAG: dihydroxy-acid dehydratase [Desulfobacterales bacterium]|nr:dihydroxy-acid dehydratase [Desulfobacterales bacterium]
MDNGNTTGLPYKGINGNLTSYGDPEFSKYLRRAFLSSAGYDPEDLDRPLVGIVDTRSDYNSCHRQMPEMIQAVKRGVSQAGGLPFAFPTISLNEILTSPTTMLYRNLAAMETEEMIRAQPMDSVVLVGGCDKTVPAQTMAAISANVPAIQLVTGPMLAGHYQGERLGACTDCRRLWAEFRRGKRSQKEIKDIEGALCATGGTCMVMGTASTMACLVETLGLMLPGGATPPHATGERLKQAVATGRRAVALAQSNLCPREIVTPGAIENAITVLMSLGGSTNAVVHLLAIARRAGIQLDLKKFNAISRKTPVLVDCKPVGRLYMEDFHNGGGMPVLLKELSFLLNLDTTGVTGESLGQLLAGQAGAREWQSCIRSIAHPLFPRGAIRVLHGSLAPGGAVVKVAAASPALSRHRGPAIVFESPRDVEARIDDPGLGITPDHVLVLRNGGPVGAGMPEAGGIPIPSYLARKGVTDMVRVSDARMSGTAYGTIALHCAPEAAVGGPIGLVQNGDLIEMDLEQGRLDLCVDGNELASRQRDFQRPPMPQRGWASLYARSVEQADQGCDLNFL